MKINTYVLEDYAVFTFIENMKTTKNEEGIPLVLKEGRDAWGCIGGKPDEKDGGCQHNTAMREASKKANIIISDPGEIICKFPKRGHMMVFRRAEYISGDIKAGEKIQEVRVFSRDEIEKMMMEGKILYWHAKALREYFSQKDLEAYRSPKR